METFKGCGMSPWLVLVSPCFRENVVATSLAQCKSVVSDILGEIEFCIDIEKTYKNTQFKLYTKSQLKLMTILEQK